MQIDVKGRNTPVTDELREHVERRFRKVGKQVSEFARLDVELYEERVQMLGDVRADNLIGVSNGLVSRSHTFAPRLPLRFPSLGERVFGPLALRFGDLRTSESATLELFKRTARFGGGLRWCQRKSGRRT